MERKKIFSLVFKYSKIIVLGIILIGIEIQGKSLVKNQNIFENKKIVIIYFSHSGNTKKIAKQIQKQAGGDLFEIKTVQPYPEEYSATTRQAKREQAEDFKPLLKEKLTSIRNYDLIFIGYPNWWGTFPMAVKTFLLEHDLSGKVVIPFCTHLGSGLGRSVDDLKRLIPKSILLEGLAIWGNEILSSQEKVSQWLKKIKVYSINPRPMEK